MPARILATIGLTLALAPAASAATTSTWDAGTSTVTLTNDGDGETFAVTLTQAQTGPPVVVQNHRITATNATIPIPAGSGCVNADGGNTLSCDNITKVVIDGGAGNDFFTVSGSSDYTFYAPTLKIDGGAGNDTFTAGPGGALRSSLDGGADDDTYNGSDQYGEDFYAEPGNDTYRPGTRPVPAGADPATYQVLNASDGYHTPYSGDVFRRLRRDDAPVNLSLDGQANDTDGLGGTDDLADFESVAGGAGNDTLTAGSAAVELYGETGDDTLIGSPQSDELYGYQGNDVIRGGGGPDNLYDGDEDNSWRLASDPAPVYGDDTLDGGDGDDTLYFAGGKDDVSGGGGTDLAYYSRLVTQVFDTEPTDEPQPQWAPVSLSLDDQANDGITGANEGDNLHSDVENIDTTGAGGGRASRSTRVSYMDYYAAKGADTIVGSDRANVITTGLGNDSIDPKGDSDFVDAGGGDDQVSAVDTATDIIRCGTGTDNVGADLPGTNPGRADDLTDCENVTGTALGLEGGVLPTLPEIPKLTLAGSQSMKVKSFLKKFTVGVGVTSDQATTASGELTTTQATIAKVGALSVGSGKLASGTGKRTLKLKVAKKFRKKLKRKLHTKRQRRKGIKLTAVITVTNANGQAATARRTIKIKG